MPNKGSYLSARSEKKRISRQLPSQQYEPHYGAHWFRQFWVREQIQRQRQRQRRRERVRAPLYCISLSFRFSFCRVTESQRRGLCRQLCIDSLPSLLFPCVFLSSLLLLLSFFLSFFLFLLFLSEAKTEERREREKTKSLGSSLLPLLLSFFSCLSLLFDSTFSYVPSATRTVILSSPSPIFSSKCMPTTHITRVMTSSHLGTRSLQDSRCLRGGICTTMKREFESKRGKREQRPRARQGENRRDRERDD